jgi:hypothetical protein
LPALLYKFRQRPHVGALGLQWFKAIRMSRSH